MLDEKKNEQKKNVFSQVFTDKLSCFLFDKF